MQLEFVFKLFAKVATTSFGKQGVFGVKFHAGLVGRAVASVLEHAHVARGDAFDRAILVVENLRTGKAGVDFDPKRFGLLAEPAADVTEADDVVALVVKAAGQQPVGNFKTAFFAEHEKAIFADRHIERSAERFPVGKDLGKSARIQYRAGENVTADFGGFFDQADVDFARFFCSQLFESNRCG